MSQIGKATIVVLFQSELRAAALALRKMETLIKEKSPDDEIDAAVNNALKCCYGALYHLSEPSEGTTHVTVSAAEDWELVRDAEKAEVKS